jgi:murein DD-endopeptidase MepM/ murein hydrolase activator NlpD
MGAVVALASGTSAGLAQGLTDLEAIEQRIQAAEERVTAINVEEEATLAAFEIAAGRLADLQAELAALDAELATAQAVLDDRERVLAATTAQLTATADRLADARLQLDLGRARYADRVRDFYIRGRANPIVPVFSVESVADLSQASRYLAVVVRGNRRDVEEIDVLATRIDADERELVRLHEEQGEARAAAALERDRVADVVRVQVAVLAEADAEATAQRERLQQLEGDREAAEALVGELEEESRRVEAELAARAEAQAAAAAAAATAAAEALPTAAPTLQEAGGSSPAPLAPSTAPAPQPASGDEGMAWPCDGSAGSPFGMRVHPITGVRRMHTGVDIRCANMQPIYAAEDATVVAAGWRGGYGNAVILDHGGGLGTLYAHQSSVAVQTGQRVERGQVVGYVGSTGMSTGPHLHFEVRISGSPTDPMSYY